MNVKHAWVSESTVNGLFNLSIRFADHTSTKRLILTQLELPPNSPRGTARMSLPDAQAHGRSEDHCSLGVFDDEDLVKLYGALRAYFRETGRIE